MKRERISGVLVRLGSGRSGGEKTGTQGTLAIVPADQVDSIVRLPRITQVVGARLPMLGLAAVDGAVMPVLTLTPEGGRAPSTVPGAREVAAPRVLVVCLHAGERVGLAGLEVVSIGHFDPDPSGPAAARVDGERVPFVDLAALAGELHARPWAGRVRA